MALVCLTGRAARSGVGLYRKRFEYRHPIRGVSLCQAVGGSATPTDNAILVCTRFHRDCHLNVMVVVVLSWSVQFFSLVPPSFPSLHKERGEEPTVDVFFSRTRSVAPLNPMQWSRHSPSFSSWHILPVCTVLQSVLSQGQCRHVNISLTQHASDPMMSCDSAREPKILKSSTSFVPLRQPPDAPPTLPFAGETTPA